MNPDSSDSHPDTARPDGQGAVDVLRVSPLMIGLLAVAHLSVTFAIHLHKVAGVGALLVAVLFFIKPISRLIRRYLVDSWVMLDAEALELRREWGEGFDYRPLVVLVSTAVLLTLIEYFGNRDTFFQWAARSAPQWVTHRYYRLMGHAYWSGFRFVCYVVVPWLIVLIMPGERWRDYGFSFRGFRRHAWVYIVLFLVVLPPVVMVSFTSPFQRIYPFYKLSARSWGDYLAWEALYGVQFFALEAFFRGYMLHPLKAALGSHAVFVMALPYCMIHYDKHLSEVLGAVVAGGVLGTLSLRTGSIWSGVLIHVSVAISMDALAIWHTVGYPGNPLFVG